MTAATYAVGGNHAAKTASIEGLLNALASRGLRLATIIMRAMPA